MSHLIYNQVCHLKLPLQILITVLQFIHLITLKTILNAKLIYFWNYFSGEFCISVDCGKDVTWKDVFLQSDRFYNPYEISFENCILKGILSLCRLHLACMSDILL